MNDIGYTCPATVEEAVDLLKQYGDRARLFNGGTDLLVRYQKGKLDADLLIDTKHISDISNKISIDGNRVIIGSRATLAELINHKTIITHFPALRAAASTVGSVQIRNRATITGNICNASPAADTVPPLVVYGANVHITGSSGSRTVPIESFFVGPGKTVCSPTEIVTAVELPLPETPFSAAFRRFTRRKGVDLAVVNTACAIDSNGEVTFSLGAAGPTPVIVKSNDKRLIEIQTAEAERKRLIRDISHNGNPISDVRSGAEYRIQMLYLISWEAFEQALNDYRLLVK